MKKPVPMPKGPRETCRWSDQPIRDDTYSTLCGLLEQVYRGRWRRMVAVLPKAVEKTVDNERDAQETIRRLRGAVEEIRLGLREAGTST